MKSINLRDNVKQTRQLTDAIPKLLRAIEDMKKCGLTERAIIVLAADAAGTGKRTAEKLINSLGKFKEIYLSETPVEEEADERSTK